MNERIRQARFQVGAGTRDRIYNLLKTFGTSTMTDAALAATLGLSTGTVGRHLRTLRKWNLITSSTRRAGIDAVRTIVVVDLEHGFPAPESEIGSEADAQSWGQAPGDDSEDLEDL